jgi:hypothetical protein
MNTHSESEYSDMNVEEEGINEDRKGGILNGFDEKSTTDTSH